MYQDLKNVVLEINDNYDLPHTKIYNILNYFISRKEYPSKEAILEKYVILQKEELDKQRKVDSYNKEHNYTNPFAKKGIYTLNDLYKYMNDNFEYGGVVLINNKKHKLPFGLVNGPAKYNKIYNYNDENVFKLIIKMYKNLDFDAKILNKVLQQYRNNPSEISSFSEYQTIIYEVNNYAQKKLWKHRNVEEILNDQISNCYESSFLVGEFLKLLGINYQKYLMGRYDNLALAHMFITYEVDNKWYYFEHALRDFRGIYSYNSQSELETDVFNKYMYYDNRELNENLDNNNYFIERIDDLNLNDNFDAYFKYFNDIDSLKISTGIYHRLVKLTDLVFKEVLEIGLVYDNNVSMFYNRIELPKQEDSLDLEVWKRQVHKIIRKHVINIGFYIKDEPSTIYTLNVDGGFNKYANIISIGDSKLNSQLMYSKDTTVNIFRVSDLEKRVIENNVFQLKEILLYAAYLTNKNDLYDYGCYFVTELSKGLINSINSNTKYKLYNNSIINLSGKIEVPSGSITLDNFLNQVSKMAIAIEVVNNSIMLVTHKDYSHDFINCFNDYLVYMLDLNNVNINDIRNEIIIKDNKFVDELITSLLNKMIEKIKN